MDLLHSSFQVKFKMPHFPPQPQSAPRGQRWVVPRASTLVLHPISKASQQRLPKPRIGVSAKRALKPKPVPRQLAKAIGKRTSVLELLCKPQHTTENIPMRGNHVPASNSHATGASLREPSSRIEDTNFFIAKLQNDIDAGRFDLKGNPWVIPGNFLQEAFVINEQRQRAGEKLIDSNEALHLTLRPSVFVWSPEKLSPGLRIHCPFCNQPVSVKQWRPPRTLHSLSGQCMYITMKYTCSDCQHVQKCTEDLVPELSAGKKSQRQKKTFMADKPESRREWSVPHSRIT